MEYDVGYSWVATKKLCSVLGHEWIIVGGGLNSVYIQCSACLVMYNYGIVGTSEYMSRFAGPDWEQADINEVSADVLDTARTFMRQARGASP